MTSKTFEPNSGADIRGAVEALDATIPETPIGERVAADLRTLAALVLSRPDIAPELARTLDALSVVLPLSSELAPDDIAAAAIELGATATSSGWTEPHWPTRTVLLPAQAIRLVALKLTDAEGAHAVSVREMSDAVWARNEAAEPAVEASP